MAIAYDTATVATAYASTGSQTTSHAASASCRGAVVLIDQNGSITDEVSNVTYGGLTMTRLRFDIESTEPGATYIYWLDNVPTGTQNVVMTTSGSTNKQLVVATMTAGVGFGIGVAGHNTGTSASVANPSWSITGLTNATKLEAFEVIHSGLQTITTTPATNWTSISNTDLGAQGRGFARQSVASSGTSLACGWTAATADDFVGSSVAFKEVVVTIPNTGSGSGDTTFVGAATGSTPAVTGVQFAAGTMWLSSASETSCNPALPADLATDDWMIAIVALTASSGSITTPAGWTAIVNNQVSTGSTSFHTTVAIRKWQSGDTAPVFTTSSGRIAAIVLRVRGADVSTPFETPVVGSTATTTTSPIAPDVTSVSGTRVLRIWTGRTNLNGSLVTFTLPGGVTQIVQGATTVAATSNSGIAIGRDDVTAGASAGAETATTNILLNDVNVSVVVKSGVTGPTGSGSGNTTFVGTSSGVHLSIGSAIGSTSFVGSAAGKDTPKGSAIGTSIYSGSAAGDQPSNHGSAIGSTPFVGSASGARIAEGSTSGTTTYTGTASGTKSAVGVGVGSSIFLGSATGEMYPAGGGIGHTNHISEASGEHVSFGTASGSTPHVGAASGESFPLGVASGLTSHSGSAVGIKNPIGSSVGTTTWTSLGIGGDGQYGAGSGNTSRIGAAAGTKAPIGSTSGTTNHTGSALGSRAARGLSSGTTTRVSSAGGHKDPIGSTSGTTIWLGVGVGIDTQAGFSVGTTTRIGLASGRQNASGLASGETTRVGASVGYIQTKGQAVGTTVRIGLATGEISYFGATLGQTTWVGTSSGVTNVEKTDQIVTVQLLARRWDGDLLPRRWDGDVNVERRWEGLLL